MSRSSRRDAKKRARRRYLGNKISRNVLAFFLFLTVTAMSLLGCMRIVFLNENRLAKIFTNEVYIAALQADILLYAEDLCDSCSIAHEGVQAAVTYPAIEELMQAYVGGNLKVTEHYTQTTYLDKLADLQKQAETKTAAMLKKTGISLTAPQKKQLPLFAEKIRNYAQKQVEFPFMAPLKTLANSGAIAVIVALVVLGIVALLLLLILFSIGKKRYKSLRAVTYALTAAGIVDFMLVGGVKIVALWKNLVIYPNYLCESVMRYINDCVLSVAVSGALLWIAAFFTATFVWRMKRNNNEHN